MAIYATKTILTCALTGGGTPPEKNPALPITPKEIAQSAIESAKAGAAVAHIHVRDPITGDPSMEPELYKEVVDRIRSSKIDLVINLTCGPGARYIPSKPNISDASGKSNVKSPECRMQHIKENLPEICTLDCGSINFGETGMVLINSPDHLTRMAKIANNLGVMVEFEVFDTGHLRFAKKLVADGFAANQPLFQLCLGIPWGIEQTTEAMLFMRDQLPPNAHWASFGIGAGEFPMLAQAALLGGHVRVGMEDNIYLEKGVLAPSNAALVEKAISILRKLDREPATASDARKILGLKQTT